VTKILAQLSDQNKIKGKEYGKQKVYVADQSELPSVSVDQLREMDDTIKELTGDVGALREQVKEKTGELQNVTSTLTTEQLKERLATLETSIAAKNAKLDTIKSQIGSRVITNQEREQCDKIYESMRKEWRLRRRLCMDALNGITESADFSPSTLMEQLGLESDKDVNVDYATSDCTLFMPVD
jgi:26S proteasome regulatory subunit (ATPase 3-interacting protein)